MKSQLQIYELNQSLIPFTSEVERGIGFIYCYKFTKDETTGYDITSIVKIPAGRYIDNKLIPFFEFKQGDKTVYPFERNYPHNNTHDTFKKVFYIKKVVDADIELFYNLTKSKWSTFKIEASLFFTRANAQKALQQLNLADTTNVTIEDIKVEYNQLICDGVEFPVLKDFNLSDITDYQVETTTVEMEVYTRASIN